MGIWTRKDNQSYSTTDYWLWPSGKTPNRIMSYFSGIYVTGNGPPSFNQVFSGHICLEKVSGFPRWENMVQTTWELGPIDWRVVWQLDIYTERTQLYIIEEPSYTPYMFYAGWDEETTFLFENELDPEIHMFAGGTCAMRWKEITDDTEGMNHQAFDLVGTRQGKTMLEVYGGGGSYSQFRVARRSDHTRIRVKKELPESEPE